MANQFHLLFYLFSSLEGVGDARSKRLLEKAKERTRAEEQGYANLVEKIDEDGVVFKSYRYFLSLLS